MNRQSATEVAPLVFRRELSAERLARDCLERVAEREPGIGAWAAIEPEQVLAQARKLDANPVRGPLHGLPVGIKDIIDTADLPTEYGSLIYRGHRPAWDAACVAAIRAAGGVIMGKTVTTEFAASHPGKTVNPHNPRHTPGGSSSGSAAAVADFMVPLAIGTQTGGSVIRPASYCGIIGYKPTFGTINRHGVKPLAESLDTVGVMARTVTDAALLAAAITGRTALRELPAVDRPRIGVWRGRQWDEAGPDTVAALEQAARRLAQRGARLSDAAVPGPFEQADAAHHDIEYFEMARALAFERQRHAALLTPKLLSRIVQGERIAPEIYDARRAIAAECGGLLAAVFADFDVLLAPSATGEAPEGLESTGNAVFNRSWTLLHVPCVTVPAFRGANGLPVGVQVIGPFGEDGKTLAIADWIHRALT